MRRRKRCAAIAVVAALTSTGWWGWEHWDDPPCGVFVHMSKDHQQRVVRELVGSGSITQVAADSSSARDLCRQATRTGMSGAGVRYILALNDE